MGKIKDKLRDFVRPGDVIAIVYTGVQPNIDTLPHVRYAYFNTGVGHIDDAKLGIQNMMLSHAVIVEPRRVPVWFRRALLERVGRAGAPLSNSRIKARVVAVDAGTASDEDITGSADIDSNKRIRVDRL